MRSVMQDVPLMGTAFLIMIIYFCFDLSKYHQINSQSLLEVVAVVDIMMSFATGYVILFINGISLIP